MKTYGAEFLEKIEQSKEVLAQLSQGIYAPKDVAVILSAFGTKLELFSKSVLFPKESPWRSFKHFIVCLESHIAPEKISKLQKFRELYNLARHNPRLSIGVIELQDLLNEIEAIVVEVLALGLGKTNDYIVGTSKRIYWIAAWEHFGDAEVHIMVPSENEAGFGPPELDMLHLNRESWEQVKETLLTLGRMDGARGHVPKRLIEIWDKSRGFLNAICFEGEYRDLLACLSQYKSLANRYSGTGREDCAHYVFVACLVAFVDVIPQITSQNQIPKEVIRQIIANYGMTESAVNLDEIVEELSRFAEKFWNEGGTQIDGPIWASHQEFEALTSDPMVCSDKYPILVDRNNRLVAVHS